MKRSGTARFLCQPRNIEELTAAASGQLRAFRIVKTITLSKIEYDNLSADMIADRIYLEQYGHLCNMGDVWKVLDIHQKGKDRHILVIPESDYILWAAIFDE